MTKNERMSHEHYLKAGSEQLVETYMNCINKLAVEFGDDLMPWSLADIMNDADITLKVLDTVFTDDIGKLELLIDIYESFDFEFPFDEGYTVDDFFINYTHTGFVDIGDNIAECLDITGKPVDGEKEEWFSRITHRKYQPCRYREISMDRMMVQFTGLYKRLETVHCAKSKVQTLNPYS
jgi:hypothetical protein